MLIIIGISVVVVAVIALRKRRTPRGAKALRLGAMSERWLAEHRASHSS